MIEDLRTLLNTSFPDYDFGNSKTEHFVRDKDITRAYDRVNELMSRSVPDFATELKERLWSAIGGVVALREAEIFSYSPDCDQGDPFSETPVLWSFNYFFYSKKQKRVAFLYAACTSKEILLDVSTSSNARRQSTVDNDDSDWGPSDEFEDN